MTLASSVRMLVPLLFLVHGGKQNGAEMSSVPSPENLFNKTGKLRAKAKRKGLRKRRKGEHPVLHREIPELNWPASFAGQKQRDLNCDLTVPPNAADMGGRQPGFTAATSDLGGGLGYAAAVKKVCEQGRNHCGVWGLGNLFLANFTQADGSVHRGFGARFDFPQESAVLCVPDPCWVGQAQEAPEEWEYLREKALPNGNVPPSHGRENMFGAHEQRVGSDYWLHKTIPSFYWGLQVTDSNETKILHAILKTAEQVVGDESFARAYADALYPKPIDFLAQMHPGFWRELEISTGEGRLFSVDPKSSKFDPKSFKGAAHYEEVREKMAKEDEEDYHAVFKTRAEILLQRLFYNNAVTPLFDRNYLKLIFAPYLEDEDVMSFYAWNYEAIDALIYPLRLELARRRSTAGDGEPLSQVRRLAEMEDVEDMEEELEDHVVYVLQYAAMLHQSRGATTGGMIPFFDLFNEGFAPEKRLHQGLLKPSEQGQYEGRRIARSKAVCLITSQPVKAGEELHLGYGVPNKELPIYFLQHNVLTPGYQVEAHLPSPQLKTLCRELRGKHGLIKARWLPKTSPEDSFLAKAPHPGYSTWLKLVVRGCRIRELAEKRASQTASGLAPRYQMLLTLLDRLDGGEDGKVVTPAPKQKGGKKRSTKKKEDDKEEEEEL